MRLSFVSTMLVVAGTLGVAAQTTQPPTGERVTVAGCLQRAQRDGSLGGTVVGTSAAPNTADDEANSGVLVDRYLLSQAVPVVAGVPETSASAAASGTTGSSSSAATGTTGRAEETTFGLQGRESELERHQGARLQVTGTVVPPATSGRGTGGRATATGVKRIKVESFKILADHCQMQ